MNKLAFGHDLLDEVELVAFRGQHRKANLGGGGEDQRVVQAFFSLVRLEALGAREHAGDNPGIGPDLRIGVCSGFPELLRMCGVAIMRSAATT